MRTGKSGSPLYYCSEKLISAYARKHHLSLREALRKLMKNNVLPEHFRRNNGLISRENQIRLLDLPIFIAGCGGLGGEMAAHLVQLGAGNIFLCDYDEFEESNLNRQRFCTIDTLKCSKATETAKFLARKCPWGEFQPLNEKLTPEAIPACLDDCAIIIDCLDSVQGKGMLENIAVEKKIPWLHGAVLAHEGFACISPAPAGLINQLYGGICRESGAGAVLSHVVAGTASLMCALFIRWLENPLFASSLLHADFSIPEMESFQFSQSREKNSA